RRCPPLTPCGAAGATPWTAPSSSSPCWSSSTATRTPPTCRAAWSCSPPRRGRSCGPAGWRSGPSRIRFTSLTRASVCLCRVPRARGVGGGAGVGSDRGVGGMLNADDKLKYDVGAEDVQKAEVVFVCPLSALAPRMGVLQNRLLRERQWQGTALPQPVVVRLT